jgi:hypothetical protein
MDLRDLLIRLANDGCYPSLYRRGDLWRAHVNAAGNFWADNTTPLNAMREAVRLWRKAGKPVDGMAAEVAALKARETGDG